MRIPRKTLDTIRDAASLVDAFERTGRSLRKEGSTFKTSCLVHEDATPSLSIDPDRGRFLCFGCGWKGDVFDLAMTTHTLSFPEAVRHVAHQAGLQNLDGLEETGSDTPEKPRLLSVIEKAQAFFVACLSDEARDVAGAEAARAYLAQRGLSAETAAAYGLGFAPDAWDGLVSQMTTEGASEDELVEAGLAVARSGANSGVYDRKRGRITFPFRDEHGRVVGFGGRLVPDAQRHGNAKNVPKYINSPDAEHFTKGRLLFGLHEARRAIRGHRSAVVVEGYLDVLALAQIGVRAVAPAGTTFSGHQAQLVERHGAERILFVFDGDAGGRRASAEAVAQAIAAGITPYVTTLPSGKDPDDLVQSMEAGELKALLQTSAVSGIRYLASEQADLPASCGEERGGPTLADGVTLERPSVHETEALVERARHLCRVIARVDDPLHRAGMAREASRALDLGVGAVSEAIEEERARLSAAHARRAASS